MNGNVWLQQYTTEINRLLGYWKIKKLKREKIEHIEAAILSYRNKLAKEIINEKIEVSGTIQSLRNAGILASFKTNLN